MVSQKSRISSFRTFSRHFATTPDHVLLDDDNNESPGSEKNNLSSDISREGSGAEGKKTLPVLGSKINFGSARLITFLLRRSVASRLRIKKLEGYKNVNLQASHQLAGCGFLSPFTVVWITLRRIKNWFVKKFDGERNTNRWFGSLIVIGLWSDWGWLLSCCFSFLPLRPFRSFALLPLMCLVPKGNAVLERAA